MFCLHNSNYIVQRHSYKNDILNLEHNSITTYDAHSNSKHELKSEVDKGKCTLNASTWGWKYTPPSGGHLFIAMPDDKEPQYFSKYWTISSWLQRIDGEESKYIISLALK